MEQTLRHDLRTPINAIVGYAEMSLEDRTDPANDELAPDLEKLLGEVKRLLAQLDSIIDFSRAGMSDGDGPRDAAPAAMFADIVRSIRPLEAGAAPTAERGRILVVDDIESNRDLFSRRLSRQGHAVAVADGGRAALEAIAGAPFDLVLLDLMMPDMNGFEVLARLKADPAHGEIPVIMVSALDEIDSVVRCIEAGAEDYLPKPTDPVLLTARINACLERKRLRDRERLFRDRLQDEKRKFEALLVNILPRSVVDRLNAGETMIADRFDNVTVLFADLVGFTALADRRTPGEIVDLLNRLFSRFDRLVREAGVEKIKTIGDAYMAVAGVPAPRPDHADAMAALALEMLDAANETGAADDGPLGMRIGLHSGPVVAGIIGTHRFLYDVWGDTVNLASRMESTCPTNRIQVSAATRGLLVGRYPLRARGRIAIKGKGRLETYLIGTPR